LELTSRTQLSLVTLCVRNLFGKKGHVKKEPCTLFGFGVCLEKTDWEKLIDSLIRQGILRTPKVIKAMRAVPRTKFLPQDAQSYAAVDTPLPIGFGQTISAPHSLSPAELGDTWFP
jgi:hypothetical protein